MKGMKVFSRFAASTIPVQVASGGRTQTRKCRNAWHGPVFGDPTRHPFPNGPTKDPWNPKTQTAHFTFHRSGQVIASLGQVPTLQLDVAIVTQSFELVDHVFGCLKKQSSLRNVDLSTSWNASTRFWPIESNAERRQEGKTWK